MGKLYRCEITTPQSSMCFEADSMRELAVRLDAQLSGPSVLLITAKDVLYAYSRAREARGLRDTPTRAATAGVELDIVQCYLRGMMISETVTWLKDHNDFSISKTVIGRYWVALRQVYTGPRNLSCQG